MGWTSMPMHRPVKEWFKEYWEGDNTSYKYEVLDSALVNYTELYGAIKEKSTGEIFCAVFRVNFSPKSEYNFMYKPMTEHVGPVLDNCPKRIFDLLTHLKPETVGYSYYWRERVKANLKKREVLRKLKPDSIVKTSEPLKFKGLMGEFSYFKKYNVKRHRNIWEALNENFEPVSIVHVRMKKHEFEVVN